MAYNTNPLWIPLDGTGTEIPALNVTDSYSSYILTGTVLASGNYAIVPTGTPQAGITFTFKNQAVVDITTGGLTFAIFGKSITQSQLNTLFTAECIYDGSSWKVEIERDFGSVVIETTNITNDSVTNAKLAEMAANTVKANITGATANPSDVAICDLINVCAWKLTGNSGTTAGTNFLGTTDNIDLVFKRNSQIVGWLTNSAVFLGVGSYSGFAGSNTVSIGDNSLFANISGVENTSVGGSSLVGITTGSDNTAFGYMAGYSLTTGSNNTCVGKGANVDFNSLNSIALGFGASTTENYQFVIPTDITTVQFNEAELSSGTAIEHRNTVAINSTNTATAAQIRVGYITTTSAAPVTITMPTGTLLGAELGATQGTIHEVFFDNTAGANTLTIAVGANAIQSSFGGTLTIPAGVTGQGCFRLMFSSPTAYTFSRIS